MPVLARSQLDERADGQDADDLAVVQLADLRHEADILDHLLGGAHRFVIDRGDEDGAVILNIDLGAGIGANLLDGLAAGADDLTDLLEGRCGWSIIFGAYCGDFLRAARRCRAA